MINQISCEELRCAVVAQSSRGLRHSAKWVAELLVEVSDFQSNAGIASSATTKNSFLRFGTSMDADSPQVLVAKTYFDLGEYGRAAHALRKCNVTLTGPPAAAATEGDGNVHAVVGGGAAATRPKKGPKLGAAPGSGVAAGKVQLDHKALFLRGYSLYLLGEKDKEQLIAEAVDPLERCKVVNERLKPLLEELKPLHAAGALDAFGLYLYAIVLNALKSKVQARDVLVQTVNAYPYIWSAWVDLALLCDSKADLGALRGALHEHWMKMFFATHALIELRVEADAPKTCMALMQTIPCTHGKAQLAMARYNTQEYDAAEELFEDVLENDPYRLEGLDSYSNILFVKADSASLSRLAHKAVAIDKYRPETCCVVGNYYSLKGNHNKAVKYFQRALKVDRNFLSAWTLLGHEFIELRQHEAAIEAYRQAVDVNPHDYRAWHGLGQTYEFMQMYSYALHYYQKAYLLRPFDERMSQSLGTCYEQLKQPSSAVQCFTRALKLADDRETRLRLCRKIGQLHRSIAEDSTNRRDIRVADQHHLAAAVHHFEKYLADLAVASPGFSAAQFADTEDIKRFLSSYYQAQQRKQLMQRRSTPLK